MSDSSAPTDTEPTEPEPQDRATNVIEAIARVMAELPGIGKSDKSEQGYQYRGIESITRHAQALCAKHCVVFTPRVVSRAVKEFTINSKPWTEDALEVIYRVYGPGGREDWIDVGPLFGLGRDNSDKGSNKAMTQAYKYALIQTFCIGDAKDDADHDVAREADAHGGAHPEQQLEPGQRAVPTTVAEEDVWYYAWGWETMAEHDDARSGLVESLKSLSEEQQATFKVWRLAQEPPIGGQRGLGPLKRRDFDKATDAVSKLAAGVDITTGETATPPADTPAAQEPPQEAAQGDESDGLGPCAICGSTRSQRVVASGKIRCAKANDCAKRVSEKVEAEAVASSAPPAAQE